MDSKLFRRMAEIFEAASQRPAAERPAFVREACADDEELRGRVESLLLHFEDSGDPLKTNWLAGAAADAPFGDGPSPLLNRAAGGSSAAGALDAQPAGNGAGDPPPRMASEAVGSVIDRYELLERIGEGGFGTVFRARQSAPLVREVALKIVKPGMDSRQVIARFAAERQALALMDHPGIAQVFDAGATASGRPYFAMELVHGAPITRFSAERRLDIRRRLALFVQVCHAVQHAHQKGVIHRDLKPSNVLVVERDGVAMPKVIDFGVAKAAQPLPAAESLATLQGQFLGTPAYMSPEQASLGGVDIDTRSDVYALGVMLYELLTGATPWAADASARAGLTELLRRIREDDPPPPSRRDVALGRELDWIVMKCLDKDRARRYQSAGALAEDVERFLRDEPIEAAPPTGWYRLRKLVRRHRGAFAAAGAIAVLLVAAVVGTGYGLLRARRESRIAEQRRSDAEREQRVAEAVLTFVARDLLGADDPMHRPQQRDQRVSEVVARATDVVDSGALAGEPPVEAAVRDVLGRLDRSLGRLPQAALHHRRALQLRRSAAPPDNLRLFQTLINLAEVLHSQGDLRECTALYREAVELIARDARVAASEMVPGLYNNYAELLREQGNLDEAARFFRDALSRAPSSSPTGLPRGMALSNLADLHRQRGDFDAAVACADEALAALRTAYGVQHPYIATALNNKALALKLRGDATAAEALYRAALEMRRKLLPEIHPDLAQSINNLASLLRDTNRFAEAEPLYREALAVARQALPPGHFQTALVRRNLGNCLVRLARFPEAEREIEAAYRTLSRAQELPPEHVRMTIEAMVRLYDAWAAAEPASDAGDNAATWRAMMRQPATQNATQNTQSGE